MMLTFLVHLGGSNGGGGHRCWRYCQCDIFCIYGTQWKNIAFDTHIRAMSMKHFEHYIYLSNKQRKISVNFSSEVFASNCFP